MLDLPMHMKNVIRKVAHKYRRLRWRSCVLDRRRIENAFTNCGFDFCSTLMVHSSLSACGFISGGAATVIDVLRERSRTVCVPTHAYCYPPTVLQVGPVFDVVNTASNVGAVTEYVRRMEGSIRSVHPTHAISVLGNNAESLTEGHESCDTPCGKGTPYERLIEIDTSVLMFGATMNTYTFFHTAEDAAGCEYLYEVEPYQLRARDLQHQVHNVRMFRQDMTVKRRFTEMNLDLETEGLLKRQQLGLGELMFVPSSRAVHQFLMDRLVADPHYLLTPDGRSSIMSSKFGLVSR